MEILGYKFLVFTTGKPLYATGGILRATQHIHEQVDFFSRTNFGTNYLRT